MGQLISKRPATGAVYTIELNQEEYDMLSGLVNDWLDNPQRDVHMVYGMDETSSVPTERGYAALRGVSSAFGEAVHLSEEYDYDDFWETNNG